MNPKFARLIPPLSEAVEALEAEGAYGSLCKLYVGMTRAKYRLIMISNQLSVEALETKADGSPSDTHFEHKKNHGDHDFARFLESALRSETGPSLKCPGEVESVFVWYDDPDVTASAWAAACKAAHLEKPKWVKARGLKPAQTPFKAVIRPQKENPSNHDTQTFFRQQKSDGADEGGKQLGTYVHELFAKLGTDLKAFEATVRQLAPRPGEEAIHALALDRVKRCLEDPGIKALLIDEAKGKTLWVERKATLYDHQKDIVMPAVFDRVYIEPGKSALIIDYKTAGNGTDESLKKAYLKQMADYRTAVSKLSGIPPEKISCKLIGIFKTHVSIVEVF
jgi:ATP-dependent exoDNAse (exonuclease V) beta subunit